MSAWSRHSLEGISKTSILKLQNDKSIIENNIYKKKKYIPQYLGMCFFFPNIPYKNSEIDSCISSNNIDTSPCKLRIAFALRWKLEHEFEVHRATP